LYGPDGGPGPGVVLLERQKVSAYTGQWIVFKSGLKDAVKDWTKYSHKNKGY